ncbi:MAG: N-acyl amino acid synthase FeeM domain-containing protein [Phycisphaerae bacterium]
MVENARRTQASSKVGNDKKDRRMSLLKRAGLFSNDTQGARIFRAVTVEDLLGAYGLTHDVFVRQGYIHPDPTGVRLRAYEALPQTATFVAADGEDIVGVTSVVVDTPQLGLPTDHAFGAEVDSIRGPNRRICEGTNWLVCDSHRNSAVLTELMRCSFAHAVEAGCTDFLGTVSPGHAKFYELLGFEILGSQRSYSEEIYDPVVLVRLDLTGLDARFLYVEAGFGDVESFLKHYYIEDNPYHRQVAAWQIQSDRLFADRTLLSVLFVRESDLLPRCSAEELDAIGQHWKQVPLCEVYQPGQTSRLPS